MEKGLVHIYCGDGKGKTSAAIGLAVRAAGNGMKVLFTRFLKTEDSGELKILDQISGIEVIHLKKSFGFYKTLSEQEKKEMSEMYFRLWKEILVDVRKEEYDVHYVSERKTGKDGNCINREKSGHAADRTGRLCVGDKKKKASV